jgi:16S rRNA (guanine966-N2)-methyltransferase
LHGSLLYYKGDFIRIIAGKFKGQKLKIPPDYDIRPTQDRVKESIFNVLGNRLENACVLDLFSGSGSLGIESISRGANPVFFVDKSIKSIKLIEENIKNIKGFDAEYKIVRKDVIKHLKTLKEPVFDIIFIDPPYKIDFATMRELFGLLKLCPAINQDSVMVYEYFSRRNVENELEDFSIIKSSHFGDKIVTYLSL